MLSLPGRGVGAVVPGRGGADGGCEGVCVCARSLFSPSSSPSIHPIHPHLSLSLLQRFPAPSDITAFRIPPGTFIKLHPATWHAGPLFEASACVVKGKEGCEGAGRAEMNFANLELADTNVSDHNTHVYGEDFLVVPSGE